MNQTCSALLIYTSTMGMRILEPITYFHSPLSEKKKVVLESKCWTIQKITFHFHHLNLSVFCGAVHRGVVLNHVCSY